MRDEENPDLVDSDCSAVQLFMAQNPQPSIELALRKVPRLMECLATHELIPCAPPILLLTGHKVEGLRAFGLNFKGGDISGIEIDGGVLRGCNFTGTIGTGILISNVDFIGCYLHGSDFMVAKFSNCRFIGCEISKNDFRDARFDNSSFFECSIYANWALGSNIAKDLSLVGPDAFGFEEKSPWDLGICEGHELVMV